VPGANLTHAEAIERAAVVTAVDLYEIELDLTTGPQTFGSTTTVRFQARPGSCTFLDLLDTEVHSITLNGREIPPSVYQDSRIPLDDLAEHNVVTVVADCRYTNSGEGLHRFVDPVDDEVYLYSQCATADARRIFANFEQPDLKAGFQLTVIAPARWQVIANQPTPQLQPLSKTVELVPARGPEPVAKWVFGPTPPLPTYLFALVAGPFAAVHSQLTSRDDRTIPLGLFCRASLAEYLDADVFFDVTRNGFAFYEDLFDYPYPFDKYDQVILPEYNIGAMENPGCVTFNETGHLFRGKVSEARRERRSATILHELAHMWFGDLVTMKWWDDLWLNESFAEFAAMLATAETTEFTDAWTTFNAAEKGWAYWQDALPSTHPIVADVRDLEDVYTNFDGITYAKGASVLKQLAAWVGREEFFAGLAAYFKKHAFGSTTLADLLVELERTSGRDLTSWSKAWLETAGTNTITADLATDLNEEIGKLELVQSAPAEHPTIRPHRIGVGGYDFVNTGAGSRDVKVTRTLATRVDAIGDRTSIPEFTGVKRPSLILLNDDDLAFAKVRLDRQSVDFAAHHLSKFEDSLARAVIWGALWEAVREAEFPAPEFAEMVLQHISAESQPALITDLLGGLRAAVTTYADPAHRIEARQQAADRVWQLAEQAPVGSDLQFQLVHCFARLATSPAQAAILRELLSGQRELPGLPVDTEMRWALLEGLVAAGGAGEAEIAETLASDNTITGREYAARVRAAIPTAEAKLATFENVVEDPDLTNGIVHATAWGFENVIDPTILAPVVARYLNTLNKVWDARSYAIAEEIIEGFFPGELASPELRDQVQAWLAANPDAAPPLRRMVTEGLADVERALRVQQLSVIGKH